MKNLLIIFLGGGVGSIIRYVISQTFAHPKYGFPWPTLVANFLGCLIIGILLGLTIRNDSARSELYLFAVVGFCGGLTTFSTFSAESLHLIKSGNILSFLIYAVLSVIGGLSAVVIGNYFVKF
tara:strand:+ start:5785 stop:6153 length:369 start_codon:yes stop_codon:yes gene_type:complete